MAPSDASFVRRYVGAFLIHVSSILDAYRSARLQWEYPLDVQGQRPKINLRGEGRKSLSS
jgi:hypothetical protein